MTPTHAGTPCVESGCFNLATHKGRCARCQLIQGGGRVAYDQQRGSARDRGYDRKWERRRRWHLKAEPFCRLCGAPGKEVDHVIPHRGAEWLFDLVGNLQTLCKADHTKKTMGERTRPIATMYPLDLPEPPFYRLTAVRCGPRPRACDQEAPQLVIAYGSGDGVTKGVLGASLALETDIPLVLLVEAPRTAERAFWSYVMGCTAELVESPIERAVDGRTKAWWAEYTLDARAEEAMARRIG